MYAVLGYFLRGGPVSDQELSLTASDHPNLRRNQAVLYTLCGLSRDKKESNVGTAEVVQALEDTFPEYAQESTVSEALTYMTRSGPHVEDMGNGEWRPSSHGESFYVWAREEADFFS